MAYHEAANEFGTMDWADICAPAIAQAKAGFRVRPHVHCWWTHGADFGRAEVADRLRFSKTGAQIYFRPDGSIKKIGDHVANPDLATTLERIARHGADIFYTGEMAEEIAADFKAHGGLMSLEDLKSYRTTRHDPLNGSYRGFDIATNHPPGGGIMLVEMLNILEHFDLAAMGHNTTGYIRTVCEAMKAATSDKDRFVGDPAFYDVPVDRLTSKAHAAEIAARIKAGERISVERLDLPPEPKDTTHVAVVDRHGNCVTMTHSLGMPSGVISDGLGFMYNGCMAVFDPRPGRAGSIAPGKSRFSSVVPTIAFKQGKPHVVLGAPGGTQIVMGVMQALLNVLDFGMDMQNAVSAPRFSSTSNAIDITNRIPGYVVEPLEREGYEVIRSPLTFGIAAVHGIRIGADGAMDGGADPGHDGVALAV
jgi:gamma-glutamyltranspeptidase/glutathione hydrolase